MLYSLLAGFDFNKLGTPIAIGIAVAVGVIALIVGLVKGFTRLGWGAMIWGTACGVFYLLETKFHDKNPLINAFKSMNLKDGTLDLIVSLSYALVCILGALLLFGILGAIFKRPHRKNAEIYYGDGDDDDDVELDNWGEEKVRHIDRRARHRRMGEISEKYHPCAFNRIMGGLVAVINAELVLAGIAAFALVILGMMPLKNGALSGMYSLKWIDVSWKYILGYTFDFLIIALIAAIGYSGYKAGMLYGFRSIFLFAGIVASLVFGFMIPFQKGWVAEGKKLAFINNMSVFFEGKVATWGVMEKLGDRAETVSAVIGKIASGAILAAVFCIIVAILGFLLKLLAGASKRNGVIRVIDGTISSIVMVAVGTVICALILALLYVLEYYGVYEFSKGLFGELSTLSKGAFTAFEEYLKPLLQKISG